eukprot:TRINITY_DN1686_c0_g1_i1.p1 TRINITY_DN1686_c0_g1~~TRINITY_DN1686_c0_g1_i1.p1  ORF type:complete len:584 (+),score=68.26 TRINITY_DN1686_c0_g1_i1:46-1797(+)
MYCRNHTDKELRSMQHHVNTLKRPVVSDLRAYRLNAASEGRLAASLPPTGISKKMRSLSAPSTFRRSRSSGSVRGQSKSNSVQDRQAVIKAITGERGLNTQQRNTVPAAIRRSQQRSLSSQSHTRRNLLAEPTPELIITVTDDETNNTKTTLSVSNINDDSESEEGPAMKRTPSYLMHTRSSNNKIQPARLRKRKEEAPTDSSAEGTAEGSGAASEPNSPQTPKGALIQNGHLGTAAKTSESSTSNNTTTTDILVSRRGSFHLPTVSTKQKATHVNHSQQRRGDEVFRKRSRSAPNHPVSISPARSMFSPRMNNSSLSSSGKTKARLTRTITDLVMQLGSIGGSQTKGIDDGWHMVVSNLENQISELRVALALKTEQSQQDKVALTKNSEHAFINYVSGVEAHYEERLLSSQREVTALSNLNSELRKEAAELRALLRTQQRNTVSIPTIGEPTPIESTADVVIVNGSSSDNVEDLIPVELSPPQPHRVALQPVTISPPSPTRNRELRATVQQVAVQPQSPATSSPWLNRSSTSPNPLSPGRQYLEIIEKNALAEQLVAAKLEINMMQKSWAADNSSTNGFSTS